MGCIPFLVWGVLNDWQAPHLTPLFVFVVIVGSIINVLAFWSCHKALELADLSLLAPFVSLSALIMIPIEYVLSGLLPNNTQILGAAVVVAGAILIAAKGLPDRNSYKGMAYYAITILCFSIIPITLRICVHEVGSAWFASSMVGFCLSIGFVFLIFVENDMGRIKEIIQSKKCGSILSVMLAVGCVAALMGTAPLALAMQDVSASEAVAIKRTMPFFALVLGIVMFKEKVTLRHAIGTALLVVGCMLVVWFQ